MAGLQALCDDGQWRWLRHIDNALVSLHYMASLKRGSNAGDFLFQIINAGDCMELISGGFYKAPIHRVIQPPEDQRKYTRLGVFYFSLPDSNVLLEKVSGSPVLERLTTPRKAIHEPMTAGAWVKARISAYGRTQVQKTKTGVEEVVNNGVARYWE